MRLLKIFLIYVKRQLKSPAFVIGGVLIPLLLPFVMSLSTGGEQGLKAGVVCADDSVCYVLSQKKGIVEFEIYDNEESLVRDVENATLNCGYILPSDMYNAFKENRHGAVSCLKSPSSILTRVSNEALFSALASLYTNSVAADYMDSKGIQYDRERLEQYSKSYIENKNAIGIEYSYQGERSENKKASSACDTLLGLTGLYILLGSVLSVNLWLKDEKSLVPRGFVNVAATVFLLTLWGGSILFLYRGFQWETALRLVLFALLTFSFCAVLRSLCRRISVICGVLPVIVCGSLVLCPVFVDIGGIVPAISAAGCIFPVFYLLESAKTLVVGTVVWLTVAALFKCLKFW